MPTVTQSGESHGYDASRLVLVRDVGPRPPGRDPDRVLPKGAIAGRLGKPTLTPRRAR